MKLHIMLEFLTLLHEIHETSIPKWRQLLQQGLQLFVANVIPQILGRYIGGILSPSIAVIPSPSIVIQQIIYQIVLRWSQEKHLMYQLEMTRLLVGNYKRRDMAVSLHPFAGAPCPLSWLILSHLLFVRLFVVLLHMFVALVL